MWCHIMTAQELAAACSGQRSKDLPDFALIVQNSFDVLGLYQRDLARDFEVAESTVSRWAKGVAKPHPHVQRLVIAWIGKRAERLAAVYR
jgi:ribosome-binding protein aMBF1 (putative translation factor)